MCGRNLSCQFGCVADVICHDSFVTRAPIGGHPSLWHNLTKITRYSLLIVSIIHLLYLFTYIFLLGFEVIFRLLGFGVVFRGSVR